MTVANVHDHLHKVAEDDQVSVRQFLLNLAENLSENRPPQVQAIEVEADNIRLSSAQVMTLGLATNEIVTNALKHAFRPDDSGTVKIVFRQIGADADLCVSDNGGGLPDGFAIGGGQGLGLRLLGSLAQQLGGTVRHDSSGQGASFGIRFPLEMPA